MGVDKVLIDRERLAILRYGIVKLAHLQKQFRVRVVRVWIVGNEFNIFLERCLGVRVIDILPIGIAEQVERRREGWRQFGRFLVILNRLRKFLLTEIVTTQRKVGALVVRISRNELLEVFFLLRN